MDAQSKAALDLLVQNGYLEVVKEKYRPTKKLNEQKLGVHFEGINGEKIQGSWPDVYIKFITDSQIPRKGESSDGGTYNLNQYSEEGMEAFAKVISSGVQYPLLVEITRAYYKGPGRYKKKIGNFISEGLWRMDYEILKNQSRDQQQETIQKSMDDPTTFTRDRIG